MNKPSLTRLCSRLKMRHVALLSLLGKTPNIRRVASDMSISQPSASGLLREIEDAVGVQLFARTVHGLTATPAGQVMTEWATIILSDLDQAATDVAITTAGGGVRLRLGISPLAAPQLLPRAFLLLRKSDPNARILVQTGIEETLLPLLINGQLDCVVSRMTPEIARSGVTYEVLYRECAAVVVRKGHPLCGMSELTGSELDQYEWILPVSSGRPYDAVGSCLVSLGAQLPRVAVESWSPIVVLNLVRTTDLLAGVPHSIATQQAQDVHVLPLVLPDMFYPVVLYYRHRPRSNTAFITFLAAVRTAAGERRTETSN